MNVLGKDLQVGDLWQGRTLLGGGGLIHVPSCVLVDCVAAEHPDGLTARVFRISANTESGSIECTFFEDDMYRVTR